MGEIRDINEYSRRAMLNAALWSLVGTERDEPDHDRIVTLGDRFGDVCAAWRFGHKDIDGELLQLAATALAMVASHSRDDAA